MGVAHADSSFTAQVSVITGGFGPGQAKAETAAGRALNVACPAMTDASWSSRRVARWSRVSLRLDWQIVRRDRHLGTTTLSSRSTAGVKGNRRSGNPSISADGQVVAFQRPSISNDGRHVTFLSGGDALVDGGTIGEIDAFRHDRVTGENLRFSVAADGAQKLLPSRAEATQQPGPISAKAKWTESCAVTLGAPPHPWRPINAKENS